MEKQLQMGLQQGQQWIDFAWSYAPKLVGFMLLVLLTWIIAGWVRKGIMNGLLKTGFDASLGKFFGNIGRWLVLLAGGLSALGMFGVETASFAAILASAGVAVGLALQGTLSNFAAGVMLLIFRPFKVGDYIVVSGHQGFVYEIDLFTTKLDTLDNRRLIVPNGQVFGATIENQSHHPARRCDVKVAIAGNEDIHQTRTVLEKAAASVASAHKSPDYVPTVVLVEFAPGAMNWEVRTWANPVDYFTVLEETVRRVRDELTAARIQNPTPAMNVAVTQV